jgi:hypothetical protein
MEAFQFKGEILRSRSDLHILTDIPRILGLDYLAISRLAFEWAESYDKKVSY